MKLINLFIAFFVINLTTYAQSVFVTDIVDKSEENSLTNEQKDKINALLIKELDKRKGDFCIQLFNGKEREDMASNNGFMMIDWGLAHKGGLPKQLGFDVYVVAIYEDGSFYSETVIVRNSSRYTQMNLTDEDKSLEEKVTELVDGIVNTLSKNVCTQMGDDFVKYSPELHQEVIKVIKANEADLNSLLSEVDMIIMSVLRKNYASRNRGSFQACEYLAKSSPSRGISCVLGNARSFFGTMERKEAIKRMHNLIAMNNYWIYYNIYVQNYEEAQAALNRIDQELNIAPDLKADYYALSIIVNTLNANDGTIDATLLTKAKENVETEELFNKVNFYLSEITDTSHNDNLKGKVSKAKGKFSSL
ncbi:hypothetical protein MY04_1273 [Flammeovirga sp. MY04]|uniref:hypothetical protein n=1 Tax=Flammeovirga sp. MY04 TaxID=1191459 RepID=UPI0008063254|nr:hypothetical protein [Flammeovirga sp. MY04]ANQ48650.1 hypothetical protein MY04_1273 [Flammeovirga sp. MY04]